MAQNDDRPGPHGDPLEIFVGTNPEDNPAQRQSDAETDESLRGDLVEDPSERSDRAHGRGSTANGVPAFDDADGEKRRRQYKDGAEIVSGID